MPEYKLLSDFPGYRVGDDGSVWSCKVFIRGGGQGLWHPLNPQLRRKYPRVGLWRDGKLYWRSVHHLVLNAFVGACPIGQEGCHTDGDRTNNTLGNLRWDTAKGNSQDSIRLNKLLRGSQKKDAKLAERDIPVIRSLITAQISKRAIGRRFGVSHTVINAIDA